MKIIHYYSKLFTGVLKDHARSADHVYVYHQVDITNPWTFLGLLFGAMVPYPAPSSVAEDLAVDNFHFNVRQLDPLTPSHQK